MAIAHGAGVPWEYYRWELAQKMGWTLEYIDALAVADFLEYLRVMDGTAKARQTLRSKHGRKGR